MPELHGAFVDRVVLKCSSDLFPPWSDSILLFQLAFQLGDFRFQGGDTCFKSCRCHTTVHVPHHSRAHGCQEGVVPKTVPIASYHLLFEPIIMVHPPKNRTYHDSLVIWNAVPVRLQRHRPLLWWLWDPWPQGHVRTTVVVVEHPLVQKML